MERNQSIVPLVEKWEEFSSQNNGGNLTEFALWVLKKNEATQSIKKGTRADIPALDPILSNIEFKGDYPAIPSSSGLAGYLVLRLFKALRFYFKPVLQKQGLSGIDDFFFLATLVWKDNISKKTLCQLNMTDIPTGVDIIKRLMKQNLLTEKENTSDKREKLMTLTNEGRQKVFAIFSDSAGIQDVMADLNEAERKSLLKLLDNLNHFHTKIYNQSTN